VTRRRAPEHLGLVVVELSAASRLVLGDLDGHPCRCSPAVHRCSVHVRRARGTHGWLSLPPSLARSLARSVVRSVGRLPVNEIKRRRGAVLLLLRRRRPTSSVRRPTDGRTGGRHARRARKSIGRRPRRRRRRREKCRRVRPRRLARDYIRFPR